MNSKHARSTRVIAALVACFAVATVAQVLYQQPAQAAETAASSVAAFPWAGSGDTSVPSAATVFAATPAAALDIQAPTF